MIRATRNLVAAILDTLGSFFGVWRQLFAAFEAFFETLASEARQLTIRSDTED